MIWIRHRSNIQFVKYGEGEVVLDGEEGGFEIGIYGWMQGSSNIVSDVKIEGLTFKNFLKHAIKMRGHPTNPNYLTDIKIQNCNVDGIKGLDQVQNCEQLVNIQILKKCR